MGSCSSAVTATAGSWWPSSASDRLRIMSRWGFVQYLGGAQLILQFECTAEVAHQPAWLVVGFQSHRTGAALMQANKLLRGSKGCRELQLDLSGCRG